MEDLNWKNGCTKDPPSPALSKASTDVEAAAVAERFVRDVVQQACHRLDGPAHSDTETASLAEESQQARMKEVEVDVLTASLELSPHVPGEHFSEHAEDSGTLFAQRPSWSEELLRTIPGGPGSDQPDTDKVDITIPAALFAEEGAMEPEEPEKWGASVHRRSAKVAPGEVLLPLYLQVAAAVEHASTAPDPRRLTLWEGGEDGELVESLECDAEIVEPLQGDEAAAARQLPSRQRPGFFGRALQLLRPFRA